MFESLFGGSKEAEAPSRDAACEMELDHGRTPEELDQIQKEEGVEDVSDDDDNQMAA